MASHDLDARITRGTGLLTVYLNRDPQAGALDEGLLRAILGNNVSGDDVIAALSDMLVAAELVMLTYQTKTGVRPIEVLREIAVEGQSKGQA